MPAGSGRQSNDPEHAHRPAACWNAFLQAETTEIERIDDGRWDMNDVLLAGAVGACFSISKFRSNYSGGTS